MTALPVLIDTHCHLHMPEFDGILDRVLESAAQKGVQKIVIPGIDLASSKDAVSLAARHSNLFAAVGVHPHEAKTWDNSTSDALIELAQAPNVVAIGEIGLDYYHNHSSPEAQRAAFHAQMGIAVEMNLPVILHNREATSDVLAELAKWYIPASRQKPSGVLHAFSADLAAAQQALEWGYLIGIGGPITYKKADQLRSTVKEIGLTSIVLETDAPFLAPHPFRGKRNQPEWVFYVAEMLASIFHTTIENTASSTTRNANLLFDLNHE
ncbi:MAG: TatD family hydrolase [Anaerolineales bacterium]|nr:TatD family hydrolase [Anaerolineales bacterium]